MKFSNIGLGILFAAWCTCAAAEARAEGVYTGSVWTTGVTESGGWYDVDNSATDKRDDNMCYAAAAANLVAWWQNGDYGRELTSSAPTDIDDIWATYLNNSRYPTSGGDPLAAVNWWISGIYVPSNDAESERSIFNQLPPESEQITLIPFSGFYYDRYALNKRKQQTLVYTVDLPEGTVRSWIPGFESLSAEEQQKTLHAICANVLRELIDKGVERLTPEELAALKELHGLPTPTTYSKALEPYA